jgi:hypothetical protein
MIALMLITSVFGSAIWKIEVKHCSWRYSDSMIIRLLD